MNKTPSILIHYGEIGLKGKNRKDFTGQLKRNIKFKLEKAKVREQHGYFLIEGAENPDFLKEVSGIVWYAMVKCIKKTELEKTVIELASGSLDSAIAPLGINSKTFRVKVKRADKKFPGTSTEIEKNLGAVILKNTKWNKVKLKNPDQTFYIDINQKEIFVYSDKIKGMGGLPVGTAGKVMVLLSGGIDSPVASYLMAKRGCKVDFVHFAASLPQQLDAEKYKINKLAEVISKYTLDSKLFILPYTYFRAALMNKWADYELILFRRFMMKIAQELALKNKAQALVTGDNLSQVASQTMENLVSVSKSVDLPILRPLLTYDKIEIIDIAKKINTYESSIEPYQDCCALVSDNPRTKSSHDKLEYLEKKLLPNYDELIKQTLDDIKMIKYRDGKLV